MSRGEAWQRHSLARRKRAAAEIRVRRNPAGALGHPTIRGSPCSSIPANQARRAAERCSSARRSSEGKHYTLVIDREWQDARGVPLAGIPQGVSRRAGGSHPARSQDLARDARRKRRAPAALVVDFPKPMDFALLQSMIEVSGGTAMSPGRSASTRQETEWRFTPREALEGRRLPTARSIRNRGPFRQSHRPGVRPGQVSNK